MPRWQIENLFGHLHHAIHQRPAANQNHARQYLFIESGALDLLGRVTEDLLSPRLKNLS
jgi:hypothetical protein